MPHRAWCARLAERRAPRAEATSAGHRRRASAGSGGSSEGTGTSLAPTDSAGGHPRQSDGEQAGDASSAADAAPGRRSGAWASWARGRPVAQDRGLSGRPALARSSAERDPRRAGGAGAWPVERRGGGLDGMPMSAVPVGMAGPISGRASSGWTLPRPGGHGRAIDPTIGTPFVRGAKHNLSESPVSLPGRAVNHRAVNHRAVNQSRQAVNPTLTLGLQPHGRQVHATLGICAAASLRGHGFPRSHGPSRWRRVGVDD